MAPLSAPATGDRAQPASAMLHTEPSTMSPHIAREEHVEQEALAQPPASLTMAQHVHHTEATGADADATAGAADQVCQAPGYQPQGITACSLAQSSDLDVKLPAHHQSLGLTAHPMAGSFGLEDKPPVPKAASQASAVSPSAYTNGRITSSRLPRLSAQNGLAGLAAEVSRREQRLLAPPVDQPALEEACLQQAAAESNGWHEEERQGDYREQQDDVSEAGLAAPHYTGSQEPVQSFTAKGNSLLHELPACEGQTRDVPVAQHVAQTNAPPGKLVSQSPEPLFAGRKRQLDGDDGHIVAKKQCVSLSGTV